MTTLRRMRGHARLTVYCTTFNPVPCGNSWEPSMDQLIQYFGLDFDVHEQRAVFLGRMICERCRQRNVQTIWHPIVGEHEAFSTGTGSAHYHPPSDPETLARLHREGEWARIAIQKQVQFNIDQRQRRRDERKAAKAAAGQLIGPPNPYPRRGGG